MLVSFIYTNLIIIVPTDGLAPNGAKPSADTEMTEKSDTFPSQIYFLPIGTLNSLRPSDAYMRQ